MKILAGVLFAAILYIIWQTWELTHFSVTDYTVISNKIKNPHRVVVIADLHGFSYGKKNQRLLRKIQECRPQAVLIPGDLIVSKYSETFETALEFLKELVKLAPVYYSFGNHETRLRDTEKINYQAFREYIARVKEMGVHILNNESCRIAGMEDMCITGLELPLDYYEKGRIVPMDSEYLKEFLKKPKEEGYHILLAHTPAYTEEYACWGADITFCGHNHGGLIRIPGVGSLLSPELTWFPKYDAGKFEKAGKEIIVSRGLGTHTYHIRIFNRAELINVQFFPK